MTDTEREALREALEKATPGPWVPVDAGKMQRVDAPHPDLGSIGICRMDWTRGPHEAEANAAFIALANPAAIKSLLDDYDRVVGELAEAGKYTEAHERLDDLARERVAEAEAQLSAIQGRLDDREGAFAWLIEAPGQNYLTVRELPKMYHEFVWTADPNQALRFCDAKQADGVMMAVRQLHPNLFAFAKTLGEARPVEHGWIALSRASGTPEGDR